MKVGRPLVAVGLVALLACGDDEVLVIELRATTTGLLGRPVQVAVLDADGTQVDPGPVASTMRVPIHAGARATIIEDASSSPTAQGTDLTTYLELRPGDTVAHGGGQVESPTDAWMLVTPPSLPPPTVSRVLGAITPCGSTEVTGASDLLLSFATACATGPVDVVLYVRDAGLGAMTAVQPDVVLVHAGRLVVTAAWQPATARPVTVHGVPPDATAIDIGRRFAGREVVVHAAATATAGTATVDLPALGRPEVVQAVVVTVARAGLAGIQRHTFTIAGDGADLDLAPHPLPWLVRAPVLGEDTLATSGDGDADVVALSASWSSSPTPPIQTTMVTLVAPGTARRLPMADLTGDRVLRIERCARPTTYRQILAGGGKCPPGARPGEVGAVSSVGAP